MANNQFNIQFYNAVGRAPIAPQDSFNVDGIPAISAGHLVDGIEWKSHQGRYVVTAVVHRTGKRQCEVYLKELNDEDWQASILGTSVSGG